MADPNRAAPGAEAEAPAGGQGHPLPARRRRLTGVDDTVTGRLNRPRLTMVAMPTAPAGRTAVDLLIQRVETESTGPATAQTTLATSLVVRDSTAAPDRRTVRTTLLTARIG
ncbi:substrate-binding domain-containing protein [Streptomyces sp. NPDC053728]|uniref:substrate-binding domain-containing protein n=1 Tax=Streptomyces sp. NPDC053728 TaxID=3155534 RepID=UPI00343A8B67